MKYASSLLLIVLSAFLSFAQTKNDKYADFKIPGSKPIKGNYLWAHETELTNINYLEFLFDVKEKKGDSIYKTLLPDTTKWRSEKAYNEPYVEYYFRHPAYKDYPVVNVSYEQAVAYCEWLTIRLNENFKRAKDHPVFEVVARLPTEKEWKDAARAENPNAIFPWKWNTIRNQDKKWQGDMMANFVRRRGDYMGVAGSLNDNADILAPGISYWPNDFGLYCMSGNAAEMLSEKGRTKGGSWRSRAPNIKIDAEDEYKGFTEPSPMIGFRCFIEVIEFKNLSKKKPLVINAKYIDKMLVEIGSDALFASKYEITNELYHQFIGETGQLELAPENSKWAGNINYPARLIRNYSSHPDYKSYPVVNIPKTSAIAFCNWMSEKYNTTKKDSQPKMEFKLPSTAQWEMAARGGLDLSPYPWGGPYLRNSKGCLLCNYNPVEERWIMDKDDKFLMDGLTTEQIREAGKLDGLEFTGPAYSYHPNGFGLYNCSGNVSEMVSDQPITKGGSWGSFQDKVVISSSEEFNGEASPYVGFRIFGSVVGKD